MLIISFETFAKEQTPANPASVKEGGDDQRKASPGLQLCAILKVGIIDVRAKNHFR